MKLKTIPLAALALAALASISQAAIVFSGTVNSTGFTVNSTTSLSIVNADISYNGGENAGVPGGPFYWEVLDDGAFTGTGKTGATVIAGSTNNDLLWSITGGAATIGSVSVYSGWTDNGRMEQKFDLYYTTDVTVTGSSTWTLLTSVGGAGPNGETQFGDATNNQLKVSIYNDASATLVAGATGLRFDFGDSQQNGGSGYKEIDVQIIPEPSAALLGGLGMLALLRRRR
jgi:hypothetical protein